MENDFKKLLKIVEKLRGRNGCPWDRKQTLDSIRENIIEEAYETVEAIDKKDFQLLKEEAGDLLLQAVFISQLAQEKKRFSIQDVIKEVTDKLIRRHPHVFKDKAVKDTDDVLKNWEQIKKDEKGMKQDGSVLNNIPAILPALLKANKVQSKVERFGFKWHTIDYPIEKLKEEIKEFIHEIEQKEVSFSKMEEEFGDILFTLVNIGRFYKIDPEVALNRTISKFTERFQYVEKKMKIHDKSISELKADDLEKIWQEAK